MLFIWHSIKKFKPPNPLNNSPLLCNAKNRKWSTKYVLWNFKSLCRILMLHCFHENYSIRKIFKDCLKGKICVAWRKGIIWKFKRQRNEKEKQRKLLVVFFALFSDPVLLQLLQPSIVKRQQKSSLFSDIKKLLNIKNSSARVFNFFFHISLW